MKLRITFCLTVFSLSCSIGLAQQPVTVRSIGPTTTLPIAPPPSTPSSVPMLSAPPVTPELWVYSQEQRRHDDPALSVRRKAELKADQRMARLAAQKWYGLSNSRPEASPIPFMGQYSPGWVGNGWNRYDWYDVGGSSLTLLVEGFEVRR